MELKGKKLRRNFYLRPTLAVAEDLLGKTIVFHHPRALLTADIVEVEAYIGENDPACHAAPGRTKRNAIMYSIGGFSYIYFIYGMYNCFNIVTEREGFPAAVLIRAVAPVEGQEIMAANSPPNIRKMTNGPGKFCRAFGFNRKHNGLDLTGNQLYLLDPGKTLDNIKVSARIGINKAKNRLWRFYDADSDCVSKK